MDLLGGLRAFVRVIETGSFSAVARETGTSQSSVTRQIGQLEDHFGVRLLHRTTRRLSLTHDGQDLLDHARHLLDGTQAMEAALGRHRAAPVGHVRFGSSVAFGLFLTPRLPMLLARYPGLSVELVMRDQDSDMVKDRLDVATHSGSPPDAGLVSRLISTYGRVAVAAPAYLARRGTPALPQDLVAHDCLIHARGPDANQWAFVGPDGPRTITVSGAFSANDGDAIHLAVLAGMGVAMLPETQLYDDLRHARLVQVVVGWAAPPLPAYIVYPSRRNLPPRTRVVIDFVAEQARQLKELVRR